MVIRLVASLSALLLSVAAVSRAIPAELVADPPADAVHPSRLEAVHIPSFGVKFNGALYVAAGAAPHPTAIILKGLPGIEQNLDLAQAIRRAGWNALTMHTRGSWGSPGVYSYQHLLEDAASALAFVRDPANAARYSIDTRRIVLVGHSTGGFIAAITAADAHDLAGLVLISATDDGRDAVTARKTPDTWRQFVKGYADFMDGLAGCTPDGLATEVLRHAPSWNFAAVAPRLRALPVLVVNSDDGYASDSEALADEIAQQSPVVPTRVHMETDHAYSDHRIALETVVVEWLQARFGAP